MLLSRALFLASAATAAMAYQLDRRQSDQNIPDDESFCECIDKDHFPDDTLTQAVCRQYPNGDFAVFESGRVGLNLVGAVSKILPAFFVSPHHHHHQMKTKNGAAARRVF